jgi:hypothetical protein
MYSGEGWATTTKLVQDFPKDATILNLGFHFVDENDRLIDASTGVHLAKSTLTVKDGGVQAAWNCAGHESVATNENVIAEYGRGPEAFTPVDGSATNMGLWAKPEANMYELTVTALNLDPNHAKTVIAKFDVDYINGRPKRDTARQDFPLSVCEDGKIIKDAAGGPKSYVSRPTKPMLFTLSGEVIAMRECPE